jgi:hypothetical protein
MTLMSESLLKAIVLPPDQSEPHWRAWRVSADLDRLDGKTLLMLPLLSDRMPNWLTGDPARGLLLGIAKRGWTENQLKLRQLAAILEALREAGMGCVVVTGSVAWMFLHRPGVRRIESLELLIRRDQLACAAAALQRLQWKLSSELPAGEELDRTEGVWLERDANRLKLSWRPLPWSPEIAADRENLRTGEPVSIFEQDALLPEAEAMLLYALAGDRDPAGLDWRCDALCLLRSRRIDWGRMRDLLLDLPQALPRLRQLQQDWGIAIPENVFRPRGRWEQIWSDYRWRAWEQRRQRSPAGFAGYLCDRWWRVFVKAR